MYNSNSNSYTSNSNKVDNIRIPHNSIGNSNIGNRLNEIV
jgi:hypothetical protein